MIGSKILLIANSLCIMVLMTTVMLTARAMDDFQTGTETQLATVQLAMELRQSSDDLTRFVRTYAVTGNSSYWDYFLNVLSIRNGETPLPIEPYRIYWDLYVLAGPPRDFGPPHSLEDRMRNAGFTEKELGLVQAAKDKSDELIDLETVASNAMVGLYRPGDPTLVPQRDVSNLTAAQKLEFSVSAPMNQTYAMNLVHGWDYHRYKAGIMKPLDDFYVEAHRRTSSLSAIRRTTTILTILQIAVIAVLIGVVCALAFAHYNEVLEKKKLVEQKLEAEQIADAISCLDLMSMDYLERLETPNMLQCAFIKIIKNLKLYKPYLPSHLIDGDEGSEKEEDMSESKVTSRTSRADSMFQSLRSVNEVKKRMALGIEKKRIIAVAVSCKYEKLSISKLPDHIAKLSDFLLSVSTISNGTTHMTPAGQFFVCFVAGRCVNREAAAQNLAAKLHIAQDSDFLRALSISCGVSSGVEGCGNVGGEHQRGFMHTGEVLNLAKYIADMTSFINVFVLIEETAVRKMAGVLAVLRARLATDANSTFYHCYEYIGEEVVANEEWLYQLQNISDAPTAKLNTTIMQLYSQPDAVDVSGIPNTLEIPAMEPYSLQWLRVGDYIPPTYTHMCTSLLKQ